MSGNAAASEADKGATFMSHAKFYRDKASEKDKLPALALDADAKAETFSYSLIIPEEMRSAMRRELADAFTKTFSQPAKLKSPSTVIRTVGRFGDRLEKLVAAYDALDSQERGAAEVVMMMDNSDFELSARMEELARLGRSFREKLNEIRDSGSFARTAGPEFDPRIRVLVLLLELIYRRYFGHEITMNRSVNGSYNGPFIKFCRAACGHFLPPRFVNGPTLNQAAIWVVTRP